MSYSTPYSAFQDNGDLHNMPQKHLVHKLLTASAAVDGKKVTMLEDNGSANAEAPLTVVNTRGFDLPIYHGTENDSLERGIGHLLGSSPPVGGESTHSILSGHSGIHPPSLLLAY